MDKIFDDLVQRCDNPLLLKFPDWPSHGEELEVPSISFWQTLGTGFPKFSVKFL